MVDSPRAVVSVHAADVMSTGLLEEWVRSTDGLSVHTGSEPRARAHEDGSPLPSVAVFDLDHRTGDVVELASALTGSHDAVVLIGHHVPAALVRRAVEAGVHGITTKDTTISELAVILLLVAAGGTHVCPQLASAAMRCAMSPLTVRERQALTLAHLGSPVADIALELHLAPGTVRNLLSAAVRKTGASGRAAAAIAARDRGWI